jgi:hypothetical protein
MAARQALEQRATVAALLELDDKQVRDDVYVKGAVWSCMRAFRVGRYIKEMKAWAMLAVRKEAAEYDHRLEALMFVLIEACCMP